MTRIDRILLVVAGVAFVFGLGALFVPGIAAALSTPASSIAVIGLIAILLGLLFLKYRYDTDIARTDLPEPERPAPLAVPGDEVDRMINDVGLSLPDRTHSDPRRELRRRLTGAAIDTLVTGHNMTEAEARERLAQGTWTDDPHAAAFFTHELPEWASTSVRLRTRLSIRDPFARRAIRAAEEISAIVEGSHGRD